MFRRSLLVDLLPPTGIALIATFACLATLDAARDLPFGADGPGLTLDEAFNVEVGVYLIDSAMVTGIGAIHPQTWVELFQNTDYNADHPPWGRMWLGLFHAATRAALGSDEGRAYIITFARVGSAIAYGLTIWLAGWFGTRWYGRTAGAWAALSLAIMPQVFAHAHLGSLETVMNLVYLLFVVMAADRWHRARQLRWSHGIVPGLLLGLAFLTKIQSILLPIPFTLWALWHWRARAVLPVAVTGVLTATVFWIGWPWLWLDPPAHLAEYLGRTTERPVLYCYYLGERFADREVPWHFPFVMTAVTLPTTLWIAAIWGFASRIETTDARWFADRRSRLLLWAVLFPLCFFALPGITVYDGTRLFLIVFPPLAMLCGQGLASLQRALTKRGGTATAVGLLCVALVPPLWSTVRLHPCQLSYYNELVGGLNGAERLGFETTYWGDSLTPGLLAEACELLPEGATLDLAPVSHPLQPAFMAHQSVLRFRSDLTLRPYDDRYLDEVRYVLVVRRRADPWESLEPPPPGTRVLAEVRRAGVQLAALLELPRDDSTVD